MNVPSGWEGVVPEVVWRVERVLGLRAQLARLPNLGLPLAPRTRRAETSRRKLHSGRRTYEGRSRGSSPFPPRLVRHFELLERFWHDGSYGLSVFVMSKFPDGHDATRDAELERVLTAVGDAVNHQGYVARIARGPGSYHPGLWDNVELHLLGCRHGIAIVEDRHRNELNPNVAMEWGWMRAMGKRVCFLRERGFNNFRADLGDLLNETFDWDDPDPGVRAAVAGWFPKPT